MKELCELGSGTFGIVYHGKWRGFDVAIKQFNKRCFAGNASQKSCMIDDFWNKAIKLADLHQLGGNTEPLASDVKKILGSVRIDAEDDRIKLLPSQVKRKDITELIVVGREKLDSVPSGGAAIAVTASSGGAGVASDLAAESEKDEKVEKEEEESEGDQGFSRFD